MKFKQMRNFLLFALVVFALVSQSCTTAPTGPSAKTQSTYTSYVVKATKVDGKIVTKRVDGDATLTIPSRDETYIREFVEDLLALREGESAMVGVSMKGGRINFKPLDRKIVLPKKS